VGKRDDSVAPVSLTYTVCTVVHIEWSAHAQFNFAKMLSSLFTKVGGAAYLLTAQVLLAKPKMCLFEKHSAEPSPDREYIASMFKGTLPRG
jgi:hypothetical protein